MITADNPFASSRIPSWALSNRNVLGTQPSRAFFGEKKPFLQVFVSVEASRWESRENFRVCATGRARVGEATGYHGFQFQCSNYPRLRLLFGT